MNCKRVAGAWLLLLALLASTSCAHAQNARMSDAQMVGVLQVANEAEAAAGGIALRRTRSRSVQSFAGRVVEENRQVYREADAMLRRAGAHAQRSDLTDTLMRESRDDLAMLDDADDYAFDRAYLARETAFLGRLVRTLDDFIRTATNPDVKTLFVRARPAFTFHLDQAHRLLLVLDRPGFGR